MIEPRTFLPISFTTIFKDIITFAKVPSWNHLSPNFLESPIRIVPYLLGIDFFLMFFLSLLMGAVGVGDIEHDTQKLLDSNPLKLGLMAVIAAPLFEEFIFRLPIGPWFGKYFGIAFWFFTFIFAGVHIFNFSSEFSIYLIPILVLPQFVLGVMLGYIRTGWGIGYSMLFHALHNGFLVALASMATLAETAS